MTQKKATAAKAESKKKAGKVAGPTQEQIDETNSLMAEMQGDAGAGQENMGMDDFAIPRINVLQSLSPQVVKSNDAYIKGAEAGSFYNTVSGQVYDGDAGITVIPAGYRRSYLEWKDREKGGGLVKDHGLDVTILKSCHKNDKGQSITDKDGNRVVETAEYFVMFKVKETDDYTPAVISMASSQLHKSKKWNTGMNQFMILPPPTINEDGSKTVGEKFNPPSFSREFKMVTVPESNAAHSWFGYKITAIDGLLLEKPNGKKNYITARTLSDQVISNDVKASPQIEADTVESESSPL